MRARNVLAALAIIGTLVTWAVTADVVFRRKEL
nr:hypothetical protein BJQ95_02905 [Cryobacterium sp. SO1]